MATIQGNGGDVAFPTGWNFKASGWSMTYTVGTEETTGFDDGGFESHEPVFINWSGSITGTLEYDASNTAPIPGDLADGSALAVGDLANASGSATLTALTGCTYAGTIVVQSLPINRPTKGRGEVTLNFIGSGPLTQTWDETP